MRAEQVRARARRARLRLPLVGNRFRLALESPDIGLATDLGTDSRTLLLAFGGLKGQLDIPAFEFFSLSGDFPVKRTFVRDLRQSWYHRGLPGYGATIPEVAESLDREVEAADVDRVVVVGSSAGGYAAILFGTLLEVDTVLCFGAQTTVDPAALHAMDDPRWTDALEALDRDGALDRRWTDLGDVLSGRDAHARYDLFFDGQFGRDRRHAERLQGLPGVSMRPIDGGGHRVALRMRETGELERVLREALGVGAKLA